MALQNNKKLKMARLALKNKKMDVGQARRLGYPKIKTNASLFYWYHSKRSTTLPVALSSLPVIGDIPPVPFETEVILPEDHYLSGYVSAGIFQPLTQLFKINTGVEVAKKEVTQAKLEVSRAEAKVTFGVTKLYLGLLIEQEKLKEAEVNEELAEEKFKSAREAEQNGQLLEAYRMGLKADRMDKAREVIKIENNRDKYRRQLAQLLDFPLDTMLTLKEPPATYLDSVYRRLRSHSAPNDSARLARQTYRKAELGVQAARQAYIPDVTLFATGAYMKGLPLAPHYNVLVGVNLSWDIFDWGSRRIEVQKSQNKQRQARLKLESSRESQRINSRFRQSEVSEARRLLEAARQSYQFRKEEFRIKSNALDNELVLKKDWLETKSKLSKAKREYLQAQMNLLLKKAAYIRDFD